VLSRYLVAATELWEKRMAVLNGRSEPDERTALLKGSTSSTIDPSTADTGKPIVNGNSDGDGLKSRIDDREQGDEEAGAVMEENPLYEGNQEMRKKLYILCPAVAIGVGLLSFPVLHVSSRHEVLTSDQVFLIAADQTIIVSSYARIGTELNALNNTSWIATAFVFLFLELRECC
jgi:hypothetical protein